MNWLKWHDRMLRQAPEAPGGSPAPEPAAAPVEPTGPDLSWLPETYRAGEKPDVDGFKAHYESLVADKAAAAERPAPPEDGVYDYSLPPDMKIDGMPEGMQFVPLHDDPAFKPLTDELSAFLKETGAPKEAGGKIASLIARYEVAKDAKEYAAYEADMKSLGTPDQVTARVNTVQRRLETILPADQAKALLRQGAFSANALKALETVLSPKTMGNPVSQPKPAADDLAAYYANPTR